MNNLDLSPHRFYASDTFDFFQRATRQKLTYDLIILDPPTFSRQRRASRRSPAKADVFEPGDHGSCRPSEA